MSRERLLRGIRAAMCIAFAVAGLAAAAVFLLSRYALPWVIAEVVHRTGYQFTARSMDLHTEEGIVLKDVWIGSPDGQEMFKTRRLTIRPNWSELLRHRQVILEEVTADLANGRLRGYGQVSKDLDVAVTVDYREFTQSRRAAPVGLLRAKLIRGRGDILVTLRKGPLLASATAQVDIPGKSIQGALSSGPYLWKPDHPGPRDLTRATALWRGSFSRWQVQAHADLRDGTTLRYRGTIEKTDLVWQIGWDTFVCHLPSSVDWRTARAGIATLDANDTLQIPNLSLTDGNGKVHLSAAVTGSTLENVSLRVVHVSLGPLVSWVNPAQKFEGWLDGTLHLQGPATAPTGRLEVALSSAHVKGVSIQTLQSHVRIEPPWLFLEKLSLDLPQTGRSLTGSGKIPWHVVQASSPNLPLQLRFEAVDMDPRLLASFVPGLNVEPQGHVKIQMAVLGRYPDVTMEGHVEAHVPAIRYPAAGLELKDLNLEVQSHGRHAEIQQGHAKLGKGTLTLSGKIVWPKLDITLTAEKATLSIPKKFELQTDATFHLGGTVQSPELTGDIRPREGTYNAAKSSNKETAQPVAAKPSDVWLALKMDLTAEWSHRLWYREGLTKIETSGDLRLRKDHGANESQLLGPVSLVRGSYDAYGRDFLIQSGDLRFTGPPSNPQLNIQGQYRSNEVVVNLSVLGTAEHPELKFTSSPPMSQQEILSFLVTGQASTQLGNSKGMTPEQQSKEMAAGIASTYLTQELRSSGLNLGMDVVRVTPSPTGSVWTVGRYLGPDLFISYGQNPKDSASSVVTADYSLSRRWSVSTQASSTSDSYVDLLFRYPLERRSSKK